MLWPHKPMMNITSLALAAVIGAALAVSACKEPKSTRWDEAGALASVRAVAPDAPPAIETGTLNKFFPKDGEGGFKRIFADDKEGYAEAKLQKDGKEVAVLSISDAARVPGAKEKFGAATEKLDGYPLMTLGKNQSSVLVKDRFQVKVTSQTLDADARRAILATFDLKGLGT